MSAEGRREQLLDVTLALIDEQGFHALSVDAVARAAGITRAVVYQHFGDLQGLLEAVVDREMSRARAQVLETTPTDLSGEAPRELLLQSLDAYLRAVRANPATWRLVLMPPEGAPESLRDQIEDGRRAARETLAEAVRRGLREGGVEDAELTAAVLGAISDEYARLVLTDPDQHPTERLLKHARWWLEQPSFGL